MLLDLMKLIAHKQTVSRAENNKMVYPKTIIRDKTQYICTKIKENYYLIILQLDFFIHF